MSSGVHMSFSFIVQWSDAAAHLRLSDAHVQGWRQADLVHRCPSRGDLSLPIDLCSHLLAALLTRPYVMICHSIPP